MFRIHMADEPETVTPAHIKRALEDCSALNFGSDGSYWAKLEILPFKNDPVCRLDYGTIHSDGTRERMIGSYHYSMRGEEVVVTRIVYP